MGRHSAPGEEPETTPIPALAGGFRLVVRVPPVVPTDPPEDVVLISPSDRRPPP